MYATDERGLRAEVGCAVDFIFEENACDFIPDEARRVICICGLQVEVVGKGAGLEGEGEIACGDFVSIW